ncbi:ABC transporter ATP-binding protein [Halovulum sp. GXIMD14794]
MISVDIKEKAFADTTILGTVRFTLDPGETLAISGPSGIGKTTLLRIVAGLDGDFDGAVHDARSTAMVFQEPVLLPWRSALRNITLATRINERAATEALAEVGLGAYADRFPGQLSLGQQRRLSLARALSASPDLLLMDEPFVSLDPALAEEMLALTDRLLKARQMATILVTHTESEARRLATRFARLEGQPAQLVET